MNIYDLFLISPGLSVIIIGFAALIGHQKQKSYGIWNSRFASHSIRIRCSPITDDKYRFHLRCVK